MGRARSVVVGGLIAAAITAGCAKKEPGTETGAGEAPERAAPPIVFEMIAAHGGMDTWRAAPTVSFEDEFATPGSPASVSRVTVEQRSRRAYMDFPATNATAAWDGDSCWSKNWSSPFPPRFLVLLNYYFLNLPWLTTDPGVKLGEPGTGRLRNDSTDYATVLMTFEPGTGDTPDDYYRLYIDPATKRLKACRYVATYQAILPKGASSSPENTLVFEAYDTVSGLVVPVKYAIYGPDHKTLGTCAIRNWSFDRPFDESRLRRVQGAVTDSSTP
jgi:hypothetical protein